MALPFLAGWFRITSMRHWLHWVWFGDSERREDIDALAELYANQVVLRHDEHNAIACQIARLKVSTDALAAVVTAGVQSSFATGDSAMNPILQQLADAVTASTTVMASAVTLINGFSARLDAAVQAALAGGATADQLAPITDEVAAMKSSADALAAAIQANTPATP